MLTPDLVEFLIVSFEGPDLYSQAGGLGVRVREMARALADQGFATTLAFVGDPDLPDEETVDGVRLIRWAQHVSRGHPAGVYQGEDAKMGDLCGALPHHLVERVVRPAADRGRAVAVLAEEWHTAAFCNAFSDVLWHRGLRERCAFVWNANNTFGFDRINWGALGYVAALTTVSRYMKHLMWAWGVNPMVIPNGVGEDALRVPEARAVRAIRAAAATPCLAVKIGRFSPDKRWHQAVSAIAQLHAEGIPARLVMRGGIEPFGLDVLAHARATGLTVADWHEPVQDIDGLVRMLHDTQGASLVNVSRRIADGVMPELDCAATAVLANSRHEPFGLVGLETMAAGGVAVVGNSGEEYARPYGNALVVETDEPAEVSAALRGLLERPGLARRLREQARRDAADFAWPRVVEGLLERLRFIAQTQRVILPPRAYLPAIGGVPVPVAADGHRP